MAEARAGNGVGGVMRRDLNLELCLLSKIRFQIISIIKESKNMKCEKLFCSFNHNYSSDSEVK